MQKNAAGDQGTSAPGKLMDVSITQMWPVNWLNPGQLSLTAVRALLGTVFGAYTDRREMQAALGPDAALQDCTHLNYSDRDELWMDYVADLGDGWDATYSIAWLLSQPQLTLQDQQGKDLTLPRGEVLLMGGDEVYPTASHLAYAQRFKGPYTAALPYADSVRLKLLAIPGNHDWYDGVSGFMRVFCQQRWVGGRRTLQQRSYFALRLPHNWWLWAVDIQLETDIDYPQKQYFQWFGEQLQTGDRVIICAPVPSWIGAGDKRNVRDAEAIAAHPNLSYIEALVRKQGAEVQVSLAGDMHHYAHYEQTGDTPQQAGSKRHKITAGGGGAFLHGTHDLPTTLTLGEGGQSTDYALRDPYPSVMRSQWMRCYNLALCWYNPAFALFLGCLYLFYSWIWQSASKGLTGLNESLMLQLSGLPFTFANAVHEVVPALWHSISHRPGTLLTSTIPILALLAFTDAPPRKWSVVRRVVWGALHGCAHLLLALMLMWFFSRINLSAIAHHINQDPVAWMDSFWQIALISVETIGAGFVFGGSMFGLYLVLSNLLSGMHAEHVYSALHIGNYKNFLRLHVAKDAVTIYAVKVEKVCRRWSISELARDVVSVGRWPRARKWDFRIPETATAPWFKPASGRIDAALIEKIEIPARTGAGL
ncbi:MAG: hypothetical protein JWL63_3492 [Rhodocyclales bacterium]|nr:hypothetical protein [Rhodocyclales bacterium]